MKNNLSINSILANARKRRMMRRAVALFCAVVLFLTVNTMKREADTLQRIPTCGLEEHTHTADCYDAAGNLVCELPEHIHTDACYQERPVTVPEEAPQELEAFELEDEAEPEEDVPVL